MYFKILDIIMLFNLIFLMFMTTIPTITNNHDEEILIFTLTLYFFINFILCLLINNELIDFLDTCEAVHYLL